MKLARSGPWIFVLLLSPSSARVVSLDLVSPPDVSPSNLINVETRLVLNQSGFSYQDTSINIQKCHADIYSSINRSFQKHHFLRITIIPYLYPTNIPSRRRHILCI